MDKAETERHIRLCTDSFLRDLHAMIEEAAQESVHEALTGVGLRDSAGASAARRAAPQSRRARASRASTAADGSSGQSPRDLEQLTDEALDCIERSPGSRVEEIAVALGVSAKELAAPMRNLLKENHLRSVGQGRATRYYAR